MGRSKKSKNDQKQLFWNIPTALKSSRCPCEYIRSPAEPSAKKGPKTVRTFGLCFVSDPCSKTSARGPGPGSNSKRRPEAKTSTRTKALAQSGSLSLKPTLRQKSFREAFFKAWARGKSISSKQKHRLLRHGIGPNPKRRRQLKNFKSYVRSLKTRSSLNKASRIFKEVCQNKRKRVWC